MSEAALAATARQSADPAAFKAAMRRFAAGVAVVTSRHGASMNGMTATAVCSVSVEPPLVLVVVNRSSASHGFITRGRAFALNFLGDAQTGLAAYFASRDGKTFDAVPHFAGETGCPLIEGCAARVDCVVESQYDQGTHTIFIGRVLQAEASDSAPLIYGDSAFHGLRPA